MLKFVDLIELIEQSLLLVFVLTMVSLSIL
jgi:hypothetical protein